MPPRITRQFLPGGHKVKKGRRPRSSSPSSSSSDSSSSSSTSSTRHKPTHEHKKSKRQPPQAAINDFWAKFNSQDPGKALTILPKNSYVKKAGEKSLKGVVKGENAVLSYEEAARTCREKVANIVRECRRINQKYVDNHFNIEFDLKYGQMDFLTMLSSSSDDTDTAFWPYPGSVKRVADIFDNPKFFVEGATANDIRQGRDGDCWFMAALGTLGNKEGLIEKVCVARDEQVGVYGFVFHRDGEWFSEIIDDKLYLIKPDYDTSWEERNLIEDRQRIDSEEDYRKLYQSNSGALYFAQCEDPNETWLPLLEKAYAKAHGDYATIEGGFTGEGLEDLTGGVTSEVFSTDILDKDAFWKDELLNVNKDFLFGCWGGIFGGRGERKGIVEGHAYSILKCVEIDGKRLCLLRNPWGSKEWTGPWSDGSKEWTPEWIQKLGHRFGDDGAFWMSYEDLLKKYQIFDRTRLFTDDWRITQQWTSLTVPWSVDYSDTKFSFSLEKKAPVVIVLSQLDDRYFCGLQDQYSFRLAFRIHEAGKEDYIIRSVSNVLMHRSVSAELELEAGEYHVLVKIEAERDGDAAHVEDVVRDNAKDRRDKLLRVSLAYDLAHAKGQIYETLEEKKDKKKVAEVKAAKDKKEIRKKIMKEKKKTKHDENREKRKKRAEEADRKAKDKVKAKRKADKEKARAENAALEKQTVESEGAKDATDEEGEKTDEAEKNGNEVVDVTPGATTEPTKSDEPLGNVDVPEEKSPSSESDKTVPADKASKRTAEENPTEEKSTEETAAAPTEKSTEDPSPEAVPVNDSDDESDAQSDILSVVSEISSTALENAVAEAAEAAQNVVHPPVVHEDDEFQNDPWNAVAVVGLRVYSRDSSVSVKVVRPRVWEDGEGKLDVDDPAADATKGIGGEDDTKEGENSESNKKDEEGSESSGVIV